MQNDFGNVEWTINKKLAQKEDHRIVSQSGSIEIRLDDKALGELEMSLFTECGVLHLANEIGGFKSKMFTSMEGELVRRSWHALVRADQPQGSMIRWRVSRHSARGRCPSWTTPKAGCRRDQPGGHHHGHSGRSGETLIGKVSR